MANVNNYFTRKRLKYFIFAFHNDNKATTNKLKQYPMKKLMTLALAGIVLTMVLAACKTTSGHGCDAYGKLDQTTNADLASK
jgi:predicted small secreted protein